MENIELIIGAIALFGSCIILIALLAFWGYKSKKAITNEQIDNGCYYLGGENGGVDKKFLEDHPISKQIYNKLLKHGRTNRWYDNEINEILNLGAGAFITSGVLSNNDVIVVVPNEMIMVFGDSGSATPGAYGQIYCGKGIEIFNKQFKRNYIQKSIGSYTTTTPAKKKSVIGNAVAGAVIAGGAGAVVGAIHAANHNSNAKDTVKRHYIYGNEIASQYFSFEYYKSKNAFVIDKMYVSGDIKVKIYPDLMKDAINDIYNYKAK